jgi:hypothetical protein
MGLILAAISFFSGFQGCFSQSTAEITNIQFFERNDFLIITYDIEKAERKEIFEVSVTINTASGQLIRPRAITGDFGLKVLGGKEKRIFWDLNKDRIFLNEAVKVVIEVTSLGVPEKFVSRGKAVLLSTFVPGFGITKLNNGGAYWLIAVATYSLGAGSAVFYFLADDTYSKYLASTGIDERNSYYDKAESQNLTSEILMYAAGAVWLGNMIWTLAQPNKTKQAKGISFGGSIDPVTGKPALGVRYRF